MQTDRQTGGLVKKSKRRNSPPNYSLFVLKISETVSDAYIISPNMWGGRHRTTITFGESVPHFRTVNNSRAFHWQPRQHHHTPLCPDLCSAHPPTIQSSTAVSPSSPPLTLPDGIFCHRLLYGCGSFEQIANWCVIAEKQEKNWGTHRTRRRHCKALNFILALYYYICKTTKRLMGLYSIWDPNSTPCQSMMPMGSWFACRLSI